MADEFNAADHPDQRVDVSTDKWQKFVLGTDIPIGTWRDRCRFIWQALFRGGLQLEFSMKVKGNAYLDDLRLTLNDEAVFGITSESSDYWSIN